jgi:hypothetical protein
LPYKVSKQGSYWPGASASERRRLLLAQWSEIASLLDREVGGCAAELASPIQDATRVELKAYEDRLNAIV